MQKSIAFHFYRLGNGIPDICCANSGMTQLFTETHHKESLFKEQERVLLKTTQNKMAENIPAIPLLY
ncbi:MAG: hypothetical protein WCQ96_05310 [Patescibacteria group bacterium]